MLILAAGQAAMAQTPLGNGVPRVISGSATSRRSVARK
jgi:hypothetical protein